MNLEELKKKIEITSKQLCSVQDVYWSEIRKIKSNIQKEIERLIFEEKCFSGCKLIPYYIIDSFRLEGCERQQLEMGNIAINHGVYLDFKNIKIGFSNSIMYFQTSNYRNLVDFCKQTGIKISKKIIDQKKEYIFNKMQALKLEENNIKILEEII